MHLWLSVPLTPLAKKPKLHALKELTWAELKSLESNLNIIPSRGYGQVSGYYIPTRPPPVTKDDLACLPLTPREVKGLVNDLSAKGRIYGLRCLRCPVKGKLLVKWQYLPLLIETEVSQRILDSMEITQGEYYTQPAIRLNQAHTKQLQVG